MLLRAQGNLQQLADAIGVLNYGIEIPAYMSTEHHVIARQKAQRRREKAR